MKALRLAPGEWNDRNPRIVPRGLVTGPVWLPELRGLEPYTALLRAIRQVVAHPAALQAFPYDWRLPVSLNAALLGEAAQRHLEAWRCRPEASADAKILIVAHSMGGLLARHLTGRLGGAEYVRRTIAVGTPFQGSVKAALMLNQGRGAPLPRRRLRKLAVTLPAVHDLLPSYRCVITGGKARQLGLADIVDLGGDPHLAKLSLDARAQPAEAGVDALRTIVGLGQPTAQSLFLRDGVVTGVNALDADGGGDAVNRDGDETVYSESAAGGVEPSLFVCQTHGGLAGHPEVAFDIAARLVRRRSGAPLGQRPQPLGLVLPDAVPANVSFTVRVHGPLDPAGLRVWAQECDTNRQAAVCRALRVSAGGTAPDDGPGVVGDLVLPRPGLYRVLVKRGAPSPVSQLVMALPGAVFEDTRADG
nr:hypothetical protein [Streptomyces sp. SID3343]